MTLSLNFRSDLIPEGPSAINGLERTLGGFLLLAADLPRTAHGHCKERECPKEPPIRPFSRRRNRATRSSCEICTPGWKGLRNWPRSRANVGRGQSRLPQGRRGTECDPGCRSLPGLPAENTPDSTPSSRSPPSSKPCSERRERELRGISDACGKIPPAACASYLKKAGTRRAKSRISRRLSQRVRCSNPYLTRRARSHLPGPGTAPKLKACSRVLSSWPKIGTL